MNEHAPDDFQKPRHVFIIPFSPSFVFPVSPPTVVRVRTYPAWRSTINSFGGMRPCSRRKVNKILRTCCNNILIFSQKYLRRDQYPHDSVLVHELYRLVQNT